MRGESPRFEHAVVGVALDGEEDVSAADVVVLLGWGAWVPAVARQLAVGGIEELTALAFVLADEEHEWRLVGVGLRRVAPPPAEEGVVAAELVVVLVDASSAVVLDEEPCARPGPRSRHELELAVVVGAHELHWGTRFVASDECDAHPQYKSRLVEAAERDTVLTRLFDVGWDAPHRVLRNSTYQRWEAAGRPEAGQRPSEGEEVAPGILRYALNMPLLATKGDVEAMAMYAGQSVGMIDTVEPAAAIIERFAAALRPA